MPRYADPARCPDCAASLPAAPGLCPTCGLPLTGPLAAELLRTLRRADDLVVQLRHSAPALVPSPSPDAESATKAVDSTQKPGRVGDTSSRLDGPGGLESALPVYPPPTGGGFPPPAPAFASAATGPRRTGLHALSVPKILLGLGATCLLVAAVIFLAVAWSWIGIGGRTALLVAATIATGALGVRLGRRDLRVGAEALTTVSLGLLGLDLAGAQNAGWFGGLHGGGMGIVVGTTLAAAGAGLLMALQRDQRRLVVPQLAVVLGTGTAMVAVHALVDAVTAVMVVELVLCAVVVRVVLGHAVPFVVGGIASIGALGWLVLGGYGLSEAVWIDGPTTLHALWVEGDGVALLAVVLLTLLPIAVTPRRNVVVQSALALTALTATCLLVLPSLDNGATDAASAWLVALLVWTLLCYLVRRPGAPTALAQVSIAVLAPLGLAALVGVAVVVELLGRAAVNVLGSGLAFGEGAGVRLDVLATRTHPALLVPYAAALLLAAYVALPWRRFVPLVSALVLAVAGLATLAQYAVPLAVVVGVLVALGLAALGDAVRRPPPVGLLETGAAVVLLGAGTLVALPSAGLTAASLGAVLVAAVLVLLLARAQSLGSSGTQVSVLVGRAAGAVVPLAWAGVVVAGAEAIDTPLSWCALVIMAAAGVFAIALPRVEIEVATVVAALLSAPAAIAAAGDGSLSLALHLTLGGVLVTATSLVHRDRRLLAIPGGLLLAAATWVRLADLGVTAPEAYTLPMALVLLALGVDRMRRDDAAPTALALLPGLLLATVPSLLWVLDDPVTLRALLLGVACLVLVLGGAQARWSAPLAVGAVIGAVLVVRELAPYVGQTPQWVVIGLAGTVLTVVGVTWEKRLHDVQQATEYLGRLR
ncbi:hypothetical protein BH09ACT12_BH09ACT12_01610 [soil metagenome]